MSTGFLSGNQGFSRRGVAILFSVLLVSVVLTVSLTLLNLAYRQIILSSISKESGVAFYAADAGLKCARFWDQEIMPETDRPFGYYDYSDETGWVFQFNPAAATINCEGDLITLLESDNSGAEYRGSFIMTLAVSGGSGARRACSLVSVRKNNNPNPDGSDRETSIESRGYNLYDESTPDECPPTSFPRLLVERGIRTVY